MPRSPLPALGLAVLATFAGPGIASGAEYEPMREAAVRSCEAIDPSEYRSGLFFNPEGHRSYYVRSECFQRIAVQFRDEELCAQVRRRRAWFSSSWGYSKSQCRKLVREGLAADEEALQGEKRRYQRGRVTLVDFAVERNGNGRDYDILPTFEGGPGHGYRLRIELLRAGEAVTIHSGGYHLSGESRLRVFVRSEEIRERLPGFAAGQRHPLRATLILEVGRGGPGGWWSDAFVERVFPAGERSQSIERDVRF